MEEYVLELEKSQKKSAVNFRSVYKKLLNPPIIYFLPDRFQSF